MFDHLESRYERAISELPSVLDDMCSPHGILVAGTVLRGEGDASSDLDVYAVHDEPWRQRVQHFIGDVPVETFINPATTIEEYFASDQRSGRPVTIHMFATGIALRDRQGVVETLQRQAEKLLADGPRYAEADLVGRRYGLACLFEDCTDIVTRDPDRARAMLIESALGLARFAFVAHGRWLPREKALFADLAELDPSLLADIRNALTAPDLPPSVVAIRHHMERIVGETGFFAWASEPEPADT